MIGTLHEKDKSYWKDFVPILVHAYNCTKSNANDFSPCYLMFRRKARIPLDLYFGMQLANLCEKEPTKFAQQLKQRLQQAYDIAKMYKMGKRNGINYSMTVRSSVLNWSQGT